ARGAGHERRDLVVRSGEIRGREVEDFGKIASLAISYSERVEVPPPFDQLQDRRMVVFAVRDVSATRERRQYDCRRAETAEPVGSVDVRRLGRWNVIEEAAPFVEVDHEHRARPGG